MTRSTTNKAIAAGVQLFTVMAVHALLETARDAAFLTRLPASTLPFAYLAVAAASIVYAAVDRSAFDRLTPRYALSALLLVAAAGALALHFLLLRGWWLAPYGLYVWTAVFALAYVSRFWLSVADDFHATDARRVYGWLAAGGVVGAMAGGGVGTLLSWLGLASWLIPVAAAILVVCGVVLGVRRPKPLAPALAQEAGTARPARDEGVDAKAHLLGIGAFALLATVAVTLLDMVFKAQVARQIPVAELAFFFSALQVLVGGLALVGQIVLAPRIASWFGVSGTLVALPVALGAALVALLASPGLGALAVSRITDGALRNTVHRSALEMLYQPVPTALRARWKTTVDLVGQRGGQVLASSLALLLGFAMWDLRAAAAVLATIVAGWALLAVTMGRSYVDLFRRRVQAGVRDTHVDAPALDVSSLEILVAALGSEHDDQVEASIDLLEAYERTAFVPALLLYHPSRTVVLRALSALERTRRRDLVGPARRLLESTDDSLHAAAAHAIAGVLTDTELDAELARPHPTAARVALLAARAAGTGAVSAPRAALALTELEKIIGTGSSVARLALAHAIAARPSPALGPLLRGLTEVSDESPAFMGGVAGAIGAMGAAEFAPKLVSWLGHPAARPPVRAALCALGDAGFGALEAALADESLPRNVRAHVPRSIARFNRPDAARALAVRLGSERDGWVRFKLIRGLGKLRHFVADHTISAAQLHAPSLESARRAGKMLEWRLAMSAELAQLPALRSPTAKLLLEILLEKETSAIGRLVRLVGLSLPERAARSVTYTLTHTGASGRGEALELLVLNAPSALADMVEALLEETDDEERLVALAALGLASAAPRGPATRASYEARLREMLKSPGEALHAVVEHHLRELDELVNNASQSGTPSAPTSAAAPSSADAHSQAHPAADTSAGVARRLLGLFERPGWNT